ncbi:hypothetical protein CQA53_04595 [Helicobacter didelphidarum]|uniref:DUF4136 domain-containing protein n=1 Tax=Helicobacter didelphidarum TaxID=2040648 RepID=A0A3D8IMA2_9HELI|nr:hypothetical protein [Helicobacter didelphidarum]RDU66085.1 hypothetical protein CQA53_04595 [Helicobacter didelphidarum]
MTKIILATKLLIFTISSGFIALVFTACLGNGNLKAEYYSTVLPTYDFDTNAPTIIVADPWDLSSKYYAGQALEAFKKRGFNNIYLQGQIDSSFARNMIYVKVGKERVDPASNYQYTFNTTGICNVINGVPKCSVDTRNSEATPTNVKRTIRDSYRISFDWFDVYKKTRVLYVAGSATIDSGTYTDLQVLTILLNDTITRMEFRKPVQYIYNSSLGGH